VTPRGPGRWTLGGIEVFSVKQATQNEERNTV
jgi:hypothetical protein